MTNMNKKEFDSIIRKNLEDLGNKQCFEYKIEGRKKPYENYYNKEAFELFCDDMRYGHWKKYDAGEGGELKEHKKNGKIFPPKMASVASSSRFCYLALAEGAERLGIKGKVEFEYACRINGMRGGKAPQLDAYFAESNTFFEVKCHEIFDAHTRELKKSYWKKLYGRGNDFGFEEKDFEFEKSETGSQGDGFNIPLKQFGINDSEFHMDVKQFLCHLMGVASKGKNSTLAYLFFKPEYENAELEQVFEELQKEIRRIFNSKPIRNFCNKNEINLRVYIQNSKIMESVNAGSTKLIIDVPYEK